ncbi:MAG: hypothetical protein KKG09_04620 [Verrucomicrobia bacterium]|nr:hypothetical protein [Verrucomicrobiota bacterium]MBU4289455.1 hypothetical protein [Verrucomicrobiota bacterium]MBU4428725.1 hypothetical protein [Verrucomicrobiota bacterium]MBU4497269.1 hypothetical protein [Verrucomicrobiota bacterium]MCG2679162.1 hypothetical protein [Kiritimatiellia bacterium]
MADAKRVVCIIDDDPSIRCGFKRLMDAYGYDTQVFASGREFLAGGLPAVLSAQSMQAGIPGPDACLIIDVAMADDSCVPPDSLLREFIGGSRSTY